MKKEVRAKEMSIKSPIAHRRIILALLGLIVLAFLILPNAYTSVSYRYFAPYAPSSSAKVFVTNYGSSNISVIQGTSVITTIKVGTDPFGIAYASKTNQVFVANFGNESVSVINVTTDTVVKTIANYTYPYLFSAPLGVAYVPPYNMVYVSDPGKNTVDAINVSTDKVVASIAVGDEPSFMAYDSANGRLYVANTAGALKGTLEYVGTISVINPSTNTVVNTLNPGFWPRGLAYDSKNSEMYIANSGAPGVLASSIDAYNKTNSLKLNFKNAKQPWNVAFNSGNDEIYVTDYTANAVYLFNSTNSLIGTKTGFSAPTGIAYNPSNEDTYILNAGNKTVTAVSSSGSSTSLAVGTDPYGIAVT